MADTGWISPGSALQCACGGCNGWSSASVNNCKIQNDTYATCDISKLNWSAYIRAYNFSFGIPAGATIDGIEVRYEAYGATANIIEDTIQLVLICAPNGDDKADSASIPTSDTDTYKVDGGPTDLWNGSPAWDYDDVTSSNFGVQIGFFNNHIDTTYRVNMDHIQMKIYYTEAGYGHIVNEVPAVNIASINEILRANIAEVNET